MTTVDVLEASEILRTITGIGHPDTIKRLIRKGTIPATLVRGRYVVDKAWLIEFAPRYPEMIKQGMRLGQQHSNTSPKRKRVNA